MNPMWDPNRSATLMQQSHSTSHQPTGSHSGLPSPHLPSLPGPPVPQNYDPFVTHSQPDSTPGPQHTHPPIPKLPVSDRKGKRKADSENPSHSPSPPSILVVPQSPPPLPQSPPPVPQDYPFTFSAHPSTSHASISPAFSFSPPSPRSPLSDSESEGKIPCTAPNCNRKYHSYNSLRVHLHQTILHPELNTAQKNFLARETFEHERYLVQCQ